MRLCAIGVSGARYETLWVVWTGICLLGDWRVCLVVMSGFWKGLDGVHHPQESDDPMIGSGWCLGVDGTRCLGWRVKRGWK